MVKEIRFYKFKRLVVWTKGKFGTGDGLLGYGICARCKKQASVVRDAFSEAFGAQNRLLWYATRFQKSTAQERASSFWRLLYSVQAMLSFFWQFEKFGTGEGLLWYGKFARCTKRLPGVRDAFQNGYSVPETPSYGTGVHLQSA
ncbi:unknown [Bacteroides sp. CAG:1060]|nr:unknown [Bacteroides sp. CAG:1060]